MTRKILVLTAIDSPRWTPASSERKRPSVVLHPPMTTSWPGRHFDLVHASLRPDE